LYSVRIDRDVQVTMSVTEKRYFVMSRSGVQKHGPYTDKKSAIRDAGREQVETLEEHHVKTEYRYV